MDMGSVYHPRHQQVCWSAILDKKQPVAVLDATDVEKSRDAVTYQKVDQSTPQPGVDPNQQDISVYPMLSDKGFLIQLQEFHEALIKAIINIVERWWDDSDSDFPSRMPLEPRAEEILKVSPSPYSKWWIDEQSKNKSMPAFADCLGNWRPDFLLTHNDILAPGAGFQVCEINSRAPYNAIIHTAYKHGIMKELLGSDTIIEPTGDFKTMVNGLFDHFNLDLPIHLVRGRDNIERREFALLAELKTGSRPRLVNVSDLQLKVDSSSSTGLALYCKRSGAGDEEAPERVHQIALALFPEEYSLLSPRMLRHLAKISVNDLRTSLFVNDQRLLGIILQELNNLVEKHKVLTSDQARILQEGIVPTILPGSPELKKTFLNQRNQVDTLKNDFMLKAARASRGNGHLIGEDLSTEEWETALLGMQSPNLHADKTSYVLQPYVRQPKFDILADKNRTVGESHVVGTYYTVNGRFVGLGPWRTGNGKICNVFGGGCILVNSITSI
ncbi:hypothetical protein PENPOL_c003G03580 [Penicillium polonicum]|uniref:Glutathionylspermidine synthase pre-ATP-grasp-like domain-containing protein n=1 Tax=Penicillium polonicum TaxID=60169 RepID=A0A1V6NSR4_PENPO|nr:hypothetical protein PENPOL_c003G03580 [Penicillium polonicum]